MCAVLMLGTLLAAALVLGVGWTAGGAVAAALVGAVGLGALIIRTRSIRALCSRPASWC
jgi:hypothetical protein